MVLRLSRHVWQRELLHAVLLGPNSRKRRLDLLPGTPGRDCGKRISRWLYAIVQFGDGGQVSQIHPVEPSANLQPVLWTVHDQSCTQVRTEGPAQPWSRQEGDGSLQAVWVACGGGSGSVPPGLLLLWAVRRRNIATGCSAGSGAHIV